MNAKELLKRLRTQPFQPFAMVTSSGIRYKVHHPENAHLAEGGVLYLFEPSKARNAEITSPHIINLLYVTCLEALPERAA